MCGAVPGECWDLKKVPECRGSRGSRGVQGGSRGSSESGGVQGGPEASGVARLLRSNIQDFVQGKLLRVPPFGACRGPPPLAAISRW